MKKVISILLIVCSLLSLLVPAASAAEFRTELQRAVVETALAYYYKGGTAQYDSYSLSAGNRYSAAIPRLALNYAPEGASVDDIYYTVCSSYPEDVYYNAFGIHVLDEEVWRQSHDGKYRDNIMQGMGLTDEELAYEQAMNSATETLDGLGKLWSDSNGAVNPGDMIEGYWTPSSNTGHAAAVIDEVRSILQPGDIINARRSSDGDDDDDKGHALMFLGDIFGDGRDYVIHSTGAKYGTEKDTLEQGGTKNTFGWFGQIEKFNLTRNGTVHIGTFEYLFTNDDGNYYLPNQISVTILRPLNRVNETDLTAAARFRLDRPAVAVWKTASVKPNRDVKVGDEITYTVRLDNVNRDTVNGNYIGNESGAVVQSHQGAAYSDLVLTETIPEGTTLKQVPANCTVNGSTLTWTVPAISAGSSQTLQYTVEVTGGTQVVSPEGTLSATGAVGFVGTKELRHEVVSQQFPAERAAAVTETSVAASAEAKRSGVDAANDVYAAMGYKLNIPAAQDFMDMVLVETGIAPAATDDKAKLMLADADTLTGEARTLRQMIVPGLVGGKRLFTVDENGVRTSNNRIRTIDQKNLQAGDILLYINTPVESGARKASDTAYVYLGDDYFAYYEDGVLKKTHDPLVVTFSNGATAELDAEYGNLTPNKNSSSKSASSKFFYKSVQQDLAFVLRPARVGLVSCTPTDVPNAVELHSGSTVTSYASLAEAYTAAAAGDTIVLQEDVEIAAAQTVGKGITLDLNGHKITDTDAATDAIRVNAAGVTVKNGTVNGAIYAAAAADLRLEDLTVVAAGVAVTKETGSAKLTFKNVSAATESQTAAPLQGVSAMTVEDDLKVLVPTGATWDRSGLKLAAGVKVYEGTKTRSLQANRKYTADTDAYKAVTFTKSPDVYNETKGKYYASLTEAMAAKASGDTLKLLRDVDFSEFDEVGASYSDKGALKYAVGSTNYTLDLAGYTVRDSIASYAAFYQGSGTITIQNGTLYSHRDGVNAGATVTLKDMVILANRDGVYMSDSGNSNLTVDGCTIVGGFASRKADACYAIHARRGTATIKGASKLYSVTDEAVYTRTVTDKDCYGTIVVEDAVLGAGLYSYNNADGAVKTSSQGVFKTADGVDKTAVRQTETFVVGGREYSFVTDVYESTDVVVSIGEKTYPSLEKALDAAETGDTLLLNSATTVEEAMEVPAGVTLDMNDLTMTLAEGAKMTVAGTVTGGSINADPAQITLQGEGSYLGITIPAGITGTVHPDTSLNATYNMAAGSTVEISGTVNTTHTSVKLLDLDTNQTKDVVDGKFFVTSRSAKQMGESNRVVLMTQHNGETYVGQTMELCVQSTVEQILENIDWSNEASAKAGRALVTMLDYGAAAQQYFGYGLSSMVNKNMETYRGNVNIDLTNARKDTSLAFGTGKNMLYGTSCVLGEKLEMKMYFRMPKDVQDATVALTYKGSTKNLSLSDLTVAESDSTEYTYYSYKLQAFDLADLDEQVDVVIKVGGEAKATARETLRSYLARFYAMEDKHAPMADAILSYALTIKELS